MSETISVAFPQALSADIAAFATVDGITIEDLIHRAVEAYVSDRRFQDLRARIQPQAAANGFHTDEDVFGTVS